VPDPPPTSAVSTGTSCPVLPDRDRPPEGGHDVHERGYRPGLACWSSSGRGTARAYALSQLTAEPAIAVSRFSQSAEEDPVAIASPVSPCYLEQSGWSCRQTAVCNGCL